MSGGHVADHAADACVVVSKSVAPTTSRIDSNNHRTRTAVALRHVAYQDLGLVEPALNDHGYTVGYLDLGIDSIDGADGEPGPIDAADLVVVLGGPIGANDGDRYPIIDQEIAALRRRLNADRPTLGICLGSQLISRALGATVTSRGASEFGYGPLTLTDGGEGSVLRPLLDVPVLHWHNDRFGIPAGATRLASTPVCDNQAYTRGPNVLAMQFHLEAPPNEIERWLIGHPEPLIESGIDPADIRRAAIEYGPALTLASREVFHGWLVGLSHREEPSHHPCTRDEEADETDRSEA